MKLNFGKNTFDSADINTLAELLAYLEALEGDDVLLTKSILEPSKSFNDYVLFDELLPKEIALVNLLHVMSVAKRSTSDTLFPKAVTEAYAMLTLIGQNDNYKLPAVSTETYGELSKLTTFYSFINSYLDFMLYQRLGFDQAIRIRNNGKVYILSDLRSLYK